MPSLLITVLILQLAIHLVNTVGASTVNELLWNIYNRLPTPTSTAARNLRRLQREFVRQRKEISGVSSQNEFAKWAKLRRQHDKTIAELEKTTASLNNAKTSFDRVVSTGRWAGTNGLRLFLQFWYAKQSMFWLPQGWLPSYAEWLLAFPRAPRGSVSIQIWGAACASVIQLLSTAMMAAYALLVGRRAADEKAVPQAFAANPAQAQSEKKEL
ncbi:MAG: GET complex subunit get1 [Caeruleum heppii]|nr:MAG: GET complex subunit get1 [Caeruleum heppii]